MRVLVVAPHMDDEVLGCGGVICRHKNEGDHVSVLFVANRLYDHRYDPEKNAVERACALKAQGVLAYDEMIFLGLTDERLDAAVQDIIVPVEEHVAKGEPDTVYIPFRGDNNQDHRAVYQAMRVVFRPHAVPHVGQLLMYEVPSSTDQSPPLPENAFLPNFYVNIGGYLDKKIEANRCYVTEKRTYPHPRSDESLKVFAMKRGIEIGYEFAEAFMILRRKWA